MMASINIGLQITEDFAHSHKPRGTEETFCGVPQKAHDLP
jgi:hypothetical protein